MDRAYVYSEVLKKIAHRISLVLVPRNVLDPIKNCTSVNKARVAQGCVSQGLTVA